MRIRHSRTHRRRRDPFYRRGQLLQSSVERRSYQTEVQGPDHQRLLFRTIGMLLSALLLLAMQSGSRWLGFSLTLCALTLAAIIRAIYSKAILTNLKENALHFETKLKDWLAAMTRRDKKEAKQDILAAFAPPPRRCSFLAIDALLELGDPSVFLKSSKRDNGSEPSRKSIS